MRTQWLVGGRIGAVLGAAAGSLVYPVASTPPSGASALAPVATARGGLEATAPAAKLPSGFPKAVPLPNGTVLRGTEKAVNGAFEIFIAAHGSVPGLTRAYEARLRAAGMEPAVLIYSSESEITAAGKGWELTGTAEAGPKSTYHLPASESLFSLVVAKTERRFVRQGATDAARQIS